MNVDKLPLTVNRANRPRSGNWVQRTLKHMIKCRTRQVSSFSPGQFPLRSVSGRICVVTAACGLATSWTPRTAELPLILGVCERCGEATAVAFRLEINSALFGVPDELVVVGRGVPLVLFGPLFKSVLMEAPALRSKRNPNRWSNTEQQCNCHSVSSQTERVNCGLGFGPYEGKYWRSTKIRSHCYEMYGNHLRDLYNVKERKTNQLEDKPYNRASKLKK